MKSSRSDEPPAIRKPACDASESRDISLFGRLWLIEQQLRANRAFSKSSIEKPSAASRLNRRVLRIAALTRYIE
jgi:hypothetical protein